MIKNSVLQGDTFGSLLASVQVDSIGQQCVEAGYGYQYKEELPISLLGLVDDLLHEQVGRIVVASVLTLVKNASNSRREIRNQRQRGLLEDAGALRILDK